MDIILMETCNLYAAVCLHCRSPCGASNGPRQVSAVCLPNFCLQFALPEPRKLADGHLLPYKVIFFSRLGESIKSNDLGEEGVNL